MSQLKAQVDKLLSNVSSGYFPEGYVSESILPTILSAQNTGLLGKYGTSHLRIENTVKAGKGKYRQVQAITRTSTSYSIEGHGLSGIVSKEDYRNVEDPFKAEQDEAIGLANLLWVEKEKALLDTLTSTSIMSQNVTLSGTSQFSDYNNSDPISKFSTARGDVKSGCGVPPNLAVIPWEVWNVIRFHPQLLDSLGFKDSRPGGLNDAELAVAMGVKKILISSAMYESAVEGQTSSLAACMGKHIVFAVAPEQAMPYQVSLGYLVRPSDGMPRKAYKQALFNPPGATELLVEDEYDMLISNALAGYLIKDAVA